MCSAALVLGITLRHLSMNNAKRSRSETRYTERNAFSEGVGSVLDLSGSIYNTPDIETTVDVMFWYANGDTASYAVTTPIPDTWRVWSQHTGRLHFFVYRDYDEIYVEYENNGKGEMK